MAKSTAADIGRVRKETREWLAAHTLRDARSIAADLEDAGEDASDLLRAIDDLERAADGTDGRVRRPRKG